MNTETGFTRTTATDNAGNYSIQYLPVGSYKARVDASSFREFVQQNLVLTVDQTQVLNVELQIGVASQTVTVTEAPPLVDTTNAELGRTFRPTRSTVCRWSTATRTPRSR